MPYIKSVYDILKEANEMPDLAMRAEFLKRNMRPAVVNILACVFNPKITFPDYSNVKYKVLKNPVGLTDTNIDHEFRRFYILTEQNNVPMNRKTAKLIQMLEGMHETESDLLFNYVVKKKLPFSKISNNLIIKYFPTIPNTYIDGRSI